MSDMNIVNNRAISPVIGVVLMVVLTILLASMFTVGAVDMADFGQEKERIERLLNSGSSGYPDELIWARDDSPGVTTSHGVNYPIAEDSDTAGNSLNSIVIEYPSGSANVSNVDSRDDIVVVGIDEDRDGEIDTDATDDVECCPPGDGVKVSNNGHTLTIELSGNYNLEGGDALIVEFTDVENPSSGHYSVTVSINGDVSDSGTLDVG